MDLKERVRHLYNCSNNKKLQYIEIELCKRDILYFFDTYLYIEKNKTFIDSLMPDTIPFNLFQFQKELVLCF